MLDQDQSISPSELFSSISEIPPHFLAKLNQYFIFKFKIFDICIDALPFCTGAFGADAKWPEKVVCTTPIHNLFHDSSDLSSLADHTKKF